MKIKITAAGDMLVQRRINKESLGFAEVRKHIAKGEARFINLETTLHRGEHHANQFCGGSYLRADPETLQDIKEYGFNMLSFANNHSMDFDRGGLMATKRAVDEAEIVNAGAGKNLDEAASPQYLDIANGRIALIGAVSTMGTPLSGSYSAMAGRQSRRYPGRPGVNGLRIDERLEVNREQFEIIKQISEASGINAQREIEMREGYFPPFKEGFAQLGSLEFSCGEETRYITHPNKEDMERIEKAIYEAQGGADCILVSIHSHELSGKSKEEPAEFLKEFAHRCIDAGAHAVIGHGPHLLRPIEIYKNRPIFYSLGNFVIHNECIPYAPEEMFKSLGLNDDCTMHELFCKRSDNYKRGLMRDRRMLESVIPYFEMENGILTKLELMPIELQFDEPVWRSGNPRFSKEHGIIERLGRLSLPYGTKITEDERGYGIVELK